MPMTNALIRTVTAVTIFNSGIKVFDFKKILFLSVANVSLV